MISHHLMHAPDTIAAIATPAGCGGIGIIRLSGPKAAAITTLLVGHLPKPRMASYQTFVDEQGLTLDQGFVLYFPAPHSFTGEDVVELQGHGSPAVLSMILRRLLQLGARLARPGEFSERAFLNNRLDLTQAEAIADLIHASSEQAAKAAMRSLQGEFSRQVADISTSLIQLRTYIEAAIDFSEEAIDFLSERRLQDSLIELLKTVQTLKAHAHQGQLLREGIHLVIAGPPNAGKSSLLNVLSAQDVAIVTPIPGTTRDVLHADIHLDGLPVHLIDTAGLRMTEDIVEQAGIQRAWSAIHQADRILWVVDSTQTPSDDGSQAALDILHQAKIEVPLTVLRNKVDLSHEPVGLQQVGALDVIRLSATTGSGIPVLRDYLKQQLGYHVTSIGFSARQRHVSALVQVEQELAAGLQHWQMHQALEILTEHLTIAHRHLGEITGIFTTEDLLSNIFSSFCIGK